MAVTAGPHGLTYQTRFDPPDGPNLGLSLANDVESWLTRAYPVADAAARVALSAAFALPEGFLVTQRDDDSGWKWTSASTWVQVWSVGALGGGGGSGGAGGTSLLVGQWTATTVQTFSTSGQEYPVAFGVEGLASAAVVRSAKGAGHKFTVQPGVYLVDCVVRFGGGPGGSRFIGLRTTDDVTQYASAQNDGGPAAATRTFARVIILGSVADLYIIASQSSGGALSTVPLGSQSPTNYVSLTITKLG